MSSKASRIIIGVSFGIVAFVLLCVAGVVFLQWSFDPDRLLSVSKRDAQEGAKFRLPPSATSFHATQTQGRDPEFRVTFDMDPKDLPAFWASTDWPDPGGATALPGSSIESRGDCDSFGQYITVDKSDPRAYHVSIVYRYC